jgi:hypothetical protein
VLHVVVVGVAFTVPGMLAAVETPEVRERAAEVRGRGLLVEALVDAEDFLRNVLRVGGIDAVGDVVVVASLAHCVSPGKQRAFWGPVA